MSKQLFNKLSTVCAFLVGIFCLFGFISMFSGVMELTVLFAILAVLFYAIDTNLGTSSSSKTIS